jgi:hypothetical protein
MSSDTQPDERPFLSCECCYFENDPLKGARYTREQLITHASEKHNGFGLCKCCLACTWKPELEKEKGWCGLCVSLDHDCIDREKYPE